MVLTQAQLALRADHAVGGVTVGLPCGDGEVAWQCGARHRDDDEITLREVAGTADDAAHSPVLLADIDLAPANRLLELGEYLDAVHRSDDEITTDSNAQFLNGFHLKTRADQRVGDVTW